MVPQRLKNFLRAFHIARTLVRTNLAYIVTVTEVVESDDYRYSVEQHLHTNVETTSFARDLMDFHHDMKQCTARFMRQTRRTAQKK